MAVPLLGLGFLIDLIPVRLILLATAVVVVDLTLAGGSLVVGPVTSTVAGSVIDLATGLI